MFSRAATLALVVVFAFAIHSALAFDTIKTNKGAISGDVLKVTKTEVTIEKTSVEEVIPVNTIDYIVFDDEPTLMRTTARTAISAGRNEDALGALNDVKPASLISENVKQEYAFLKAYSASQIALASNTNVKEAATEMFTFVSRNPNSWHYYEACELVGDLMVAAGAYSKSQSFYQQVAKAPWVDCQMRANVAIGRALLAEKKAPEALELFEKVLAVDAQDDLAARQHLGATLGKARCLAMSNKAPEAIKLAEEVIKRATPEQSELLAQAYNALGTAHRLAGQEKDALMAFLHVDILYFTSPKEHIEALKNLHDLWKVVHKPERARDTAQILKERYRMAPENP